MPENALVIGASSEAIFSIEAAHRFGLCIAALDGNKEAAGMAYADRAFHVDIRNLEAVFSITDFLAPALVVPAPIGRCLTTIGAVNDRYGRKGVGYEAAKICTDKFLFHQILHEKGLRGGACALLLGGKRLEESVNGLPEDVPCILKPRFGSGSRAVKLFENRQALLLYLSGKEVPAEDFVAEECVPGEEYGVDGAFVDGKFRLVLLRKKKITPPPYRQCVGYESVLPDEEKAFYPACRELMQRAGEAIGLTDCIVHADLIRRKEEAASLKSLPFPIEISARPSGHNLSNLFTPLATGVTLVDDFIKLSLGRGDEEEKDKLFVPTFCRRLFIGYFDLPCGRVRSVPGADLRQRYPLVRYSCALAPGDEILPVRDGASIMGRGFFILEGKSGEEMQRDAEGILKEFVVET